MLDSGITQKDDMKKILSNKNDSIEDAIGYYTIAKECPKDIYYDDKMFNEWLHDKGLNEAEAVSMRNKLKEYR